MRKITILAIFIFFCLTTNSFSQNSDIGFGIKAGANYSKFTPDFKVNGRDFVQYQRIAGFYLGGFLNIGISKNLQFQPELHFARQGTGVLIEGMQMIIGNQIITLADFEAKINESTIIVPLVFRYLITQSFFIDGGPQLGLIVDRNEKIKRDQLAQPGDPVMSMEFDFDNFDLGLTAGAGYYLTKNLIINGRYFFGLIKRDEKIKSSVFNLGLEHKL